MARPNIHAGSLFLVVRGGILENRMNVRCSVLYILPKAVV